MNVSPIDTAIVVVYLIGIIAFGIWAGFKKNTSSEDFFLGGRTLRWPVIGAGLYFDPTFRMRGPQPWPENTIQKVGYHSTDAITELTLDWLENERDPDRPFFLAHHYKAPHDMFDNAPRYDDYLADR